MSDSILENQGEEISSYSGRQTFRIGIVLSGDLTDETGFLRIISGCDIIVCADGGARHLKRYGIMPDLLVGDFDSINTSERDWLEKAQIPVKQFSAEKDFTDSELAVESSLELLKEILHEQHLEMPLNSNISLCLLAVTGDRPDHVLANQTMAAYLAKRGYNVMMTDGGNWFYLLQGPVKQSFDTSLYEADCTISAIALSEQVKGITYSGLKYPLNNYDLSFGSQRGVSNCLADLINENFEVEISEGTLMLIITKS